MHSSIIKVKNAFNEPETEACIIIENNINYIPKVSVIVPVYNTEEYLCKCLDSIIEQTLKEIEIICIDDGSNDNSLDILKNYAKKDKRITVISQKNLHAGVARNAGITVAKGEYLSFLDSDDWFELDFLNDVYNVINKEKSDFIAFLYYNFDIYNKKIVNTQGINKKFSNKITTVSVSSIVDEAFTISNPMPWNKLISRQLVCNENLRFQSLHVSNDIYFSLCLTASSKKITFYNKSFIYYRYNNLKSLRNSRDKYPYDFYYAYKNIYKFMINKDKLQFKKTFIKSLVSTLLWTVNNTFLQKNNLIKFINEIIVPEFDIFGENKKFLSKSDILNLNILKYPLPIISLTSYPARISTVYNTIISLLYQDIAYKKIILWLAEEQFPMKEKELPSKIVELISEKFCIEWCKDIRSYKKLIPALKKYPDDIIVTADDDVIYPRDWLHRLVHAYSEHPDMIHCLRAHRIAIHNGNILPYQRWNVKEYNVSPSFLNFFTGVGGVVYHSSLLYRDIMREDIFTKICPDADDIWFWGMSVLQGTKINIVNPPMVELNYIPQSQDGDFPLWKKNVLQNENDIKLKAFLDAYPTVRKILIAENKKVRVKEIINRFSKPYYKEKNKNNKSIYIFGLPVFRKMKSGTKKRISILGIQIYKREQTDSKKRISILGIPVYSKKTSGFRTIRRLLFLNLASLTGSTLLSLIFISS